MAVPRGIGYIEITGRNLLNMLLPFVSALALNYILAAYLILTGAALLVEAIGMHKIER